MPWGVILSAIGHLAGGLIHHDGNPVLRWMVANAVAKMDAAGNIKPSRDKSNEKSDGVVAWCDALYVWLIDGGAGRGVRFGV